MKTKVLLINPWGIYNDGYYVSGFVNGLNNYVDLDYVSNYYYVGSEPNGTRYPFFFKKTERLEISWKRKIFRGVE